MAIDRTKLILVALVLTLHVAAAAGGPKAEKFTSQNPCGNKASCSECIQTKTCAWCLQPQKDFGDNPRCFQPSYDSSSACPEEFTYNPDSQLTQLVNKELTRRKRLDGAAYEGGMAAGGSAASGSYSSSSSSQSSYSSSSFQSSSSSGGSSSSVSWTSAGEIVQIKPQRVNLKLRINQEYRLTMAYSQAEDYPVDLYYLMDLSKSMEDDKISLSTLGDSLALKMRSITSNFRLGFGSFVDKVLMPYVSTVPKKLESPCTGCEAPYGFKHHLVLNTDSAKFSEEVRRANVSGNLDAPEGGFDAIMQAVACRNQIGWREQARRLLVFSTDAGFHYAGDGKLGGVIKPNDGLCHLDASGRYTHWDSQDYPSISQINMRVKQSAINLIFAVTEDQLDVYKRLSKHIEGSSAGQLANDSSNVIDLIQKQYEAIQSSVEIKDNAASFIKITYKSKCLDQESEPVVTNKCNGLRVGNTVEFIAEITVTQCPKDPKDWKQQFQIYPVGLNESMTVDLELLCDCECENPGHYTFQALSPECNHQGNLKCGICECNDLYFGRHCECSTLDIHGEADRDLQCRRDNTTTIDCTGKGNCVCGVCDCDKRADPTEIISGRFCECDNFSCDRHNGLLCSGPDHGTCNCGVCDCNPKYTGTACDCQASNETCINPQGNGELCSGKGECVCGACVCGTTDEGRYSGQYCEKCPTCSGRCHEFKDCVQCQMYKTGPMGQDADLCAKNCTLFVPIEEEKVEAKEEWEVLCTFYDEDDCRFNFVYDDKDEVKVRAQKERECPPKVFILGIILGVIAAIVLIGLAILLLWKLLTTISDRREFAKFEKERMMAKWDTGENPIYKQATSTFKNPTYAGK